MALICFQQSPVMWHQLFVAAMLQTFAIAINGGALYVGATRVLGGLQCRHAMMSPE